MDLQVHGKSASWDGAAGMRGVHKTARMEQTAQTEQPACSNGGRMFLQSPGGPATRQAMKQRLKAKTRRGKILRACGETAASLAAAMTIDAVRLGSAAIGDRSTGRNIRIAAEYLLSKESQFSLIVSERAVPGTGVQPWFGHHVPLCPMDPSNKRRESPNIYILLAH